MTFCYIKIIKIKSLFNEQLTKKQHFASRYIKQIIRYSIEYAIEYAGLWNDNLSHDYTTIENGWIVGSIKY